MKRLIIVVACLVLLPSIPSAGEELLFTTAPRDAIEARLRRFAGDDKKREVSLKELFEESGCSGPQLEERPVKGAKLPNVICTLYGSSSQTIIVGAHFDHVPQGQGVVDNWSGASLLPSLFQSVKSEARRHTYIFIGFTAEERGEIGSRFYAKHMTNDEVAKTAAMVNMDTHGV